MIQHGLMTNLLGPATVLVPEQWGPNFGFIVLAGTLLDWPLVRIHSRCAYGEVFGSVHCDCQIQLATSADLIRKDGGGLIVYLEQEGRGAGISAKASAYQAAERDGVDSFSHYEQSGLPADSRSYVDVGPALVALGIRSLRLLTNNPAKVHAIEHAGIQVKRVPLVVPTDVLAAAYVQAKRERGHLL